MTQSLTKQELENSYDIYNVLNKNCMDYARYILKYRCIPSLEDGLKCIHRRSIWSFYKNNLLYNKPRTKSVNACGGVLAYSPHGDASVYGACVRLANDSVLLNLIDGKGNFSSCTSRDVDAGASRYTEMRLSEICTELLKGINKENVPMVKTYDDARLEPVYLPSSFPLILCNPNIGIGCGFSTSISSFNLSDVIDYTVAKLNNTTLPLLSPDFPTGGEYLYDEKELKSIHESGRGKLTLRAKYHFDGDSIVFTEIPYTTTREQIVEKIIELVKTGVTKDIIDVNDYTGLKGLDITVDLKKNANKEKVLSLLFKKTTLQDNFSCNFNVLDNGVLKLFGTSTIVDKWLINRKYVLKRELEYDINKFSEEENELLGLKIVLLDIDKAISIIRNSKSEKEAIENLMTQMKLNKAQAEYVSDIKLRYLNQDYLTKKIQRLGLIQDSLFHMRDNLLDEPYYTQTIIKQLQEVKAKYGKPRMTTIIHEDTVEVTNDILIPDETCAITITKDGYVKRTQRQSSTHKLKDGDEVILNQSCTTKHTILLFTNKGNVHKVFVHTLDQTLPSNLGQYLYSLVQMDKDEKIISVQLTRGYKGYLINVFENNKLAKVNISSFQTEQKRTTLKNAISLESPLIAQYIIENDIDILVKSTIDKVLIVNTSDFNAKNTKNVAGDSLVKSKDDSVVKVVYRLSDIDTDKIDVEYYRGKRGSVGCYLKKTDDILVIN